MTKQSDAAFEFRNKRKLNKKAVELTFNVIAVMILVLLVLGILAYAFLKFSGNFTLGAGSCAAKAGKCVADNEQCNSINETMLLLDDCKKKGDASFKEGRCCISLT